ncbi:MAG: gamma-glutamyltransferase [Rhodospirillales bacterium]
MTCIRLILLSVFSAAFLSLTAQAQADGRYMISAANPHAAEAGRDILAAGGSAVDAAIAAQLVLGLVEPQSSGIGGGGFLMHFRAGNGVIDAYDGRETAPAAATPEMFLGPDETPRKFYDAVVGGLSVGVPGLLRMLEQAHQDHGRLPWADLFAPAIRLARDGFQISPRLHYLIDRDTERLTTFDTTRSYFYQPDGTALPVGALLRNPAYADVLDQVAGGGADVFYNGQIAADIVRTVRGADRNPGLMTAEDMSGYRAIRRQAVCGTYRENRICGMPPPSSGGITVAQILGLLEGFDLHRMAPDSLAATHLIAEAGRLAFADRNLYLADTDFVPAPLKGLLDPGYLKSRAGQISLKSSVGKAEPGTPPQDHGALIPMQDDFERESTTHLSVLDADGNAVSMTSSVENAFGARLMTRGFILNNQLTDFSFSPEKDGIAIANRVEPGKRPRSSMSPTLVLGPDGRLRMAVGSPGGSRIIGYVAKTLIGVIDWNLTMQQAIDLPHVINRNGGTDLEEETSAAELKTALEALGHQVSIRSLNSGLHGIRITPAGPDGGADPRREGIVLEGSTTR